ncbi:MAG: hypothetical protein J7J72_05400 [Bacteroidales bacterium]|nr:hypothetical protein [Bacteroidales bacterium]
MKKLINYLFLFLFTAISVNSFSQDTKAKKHSYFVYNPEVIISKLPKDVDETSALLFYKGSLWTLNDSGGKAEIYRLSTKSGKIIQTISLKGVKNVDFEDLTQDEDYIYVGDIGNNMGNRKNLVVYKIAKKDIPRKKDAEVKVKAIRYAYADQINFKKRSRRNNYDCEALTSLGDQLYLFTKDWLDAKTRVYILPKKKGKYSLDVWKEFDADGLVTAADFNLKKNELVLLGYQDFMPFLWTFSNFKGDDFFGGYAKRMNFEHIHGAQTEGLCFEPSGDLFISCEDSYFPQRIFKVPQSELMDSVQLKPSFSADNSLILKVKYDATEQMIHLKVQGLFEGDFRFELLNEIWRTENKMKMKAKDLSGETINVNAKKLKQGLYYLRVQQNDRVKVARVYI